MLSYARSLSASCCFSAQKRRTAAVALPIFYSHRGTWSTRRRMVLRPRRRPTRAALCAPGGLRVALFVSAVCLVAPIARAIEPTAVIAPAQADQIGEMLGIGTNDLPGKCNIVSVSIDGSVAVAKYTCPAAQAEISLQHRDAEPDAGAVVRTEKFSLTASGKPRAPQELIDGITDRVRSREGSFEWTLWATSATAPVAGSATPSSATPDGAPKPWWPAWLISLALLLGAPMAGHVVGGLIRRVLTREFLRGFLAALVVPSASVTLAVLLATQRWHVGLWDSVLTGVLFGAGAVLGSRGNGARAGRASILLSVGSAALSLGLCEVASRTLLPAPRAAIPRDPPRFVLDDPNTYGGTFHPNGDWQQEACAFLYPDLHPGVFESRAPSGDGRRPVVLHVGDSMVQGYGVVMAESFPARLSEIDPGTLHINAGVAAMSVDYYLLHAERWLARRHIDRVVFYVFVGNDLDEIDQEMACCWDGPLLDYGPDGPRERCPKPASSDDALAWHSPLPYPVRAATKFSSLALRLAALYSGSRPKREHDSKWPHFEAVMGAARDRMVASGVGFAVVLLPLREALQSAEPKQSEAYAVRTRAMETCNRLGIRTLDTWDFFEGAGHRTGLARLFITRDGFEDLHFSAEGNEQFARWLARRLGALFAPVPAPN